MDKTPTVLYLDCRPQDEVQRRKLDGICRYATTHGWNVATLAQGECNPGAVAKFLSRVNVAGCIVECSDGVHNLPPRLFGKTPVVYLDPTDPIRWRHAMIVSCDDAAIVRAAFRELSAGLPSAYAVVSYWFEYRWARERVKVFRAYCREAGKACIVFPAHGDNEPKDICAARLTKWVAALPPRCAIFAVNDLTARGVAAALAAAHRPVPRTATLVGADGADAGGESKPDTSISSVKIDFELAGFLAAKKLVEQPQSAASTSRNSAIFGPLLVVRRESTRGFGRNEPHVLQAVEIIRREACGGLTVSSLARRLPGTRRLLELRFREAMGHSILEEIQAVRLEKVCTLLAETDMPVSAISDSCGFNSSRTLRDLFQARMGVSMREFRRSRR